MPAENLVGPEGRSPLAADHAGRRIPQDQALNLGIGRAAYEAALDYAQLRVQGGRRIIEHQAIGGKLAEVAGPARGCARRDLAGGLGLRPPRGDRRPQPSRPAAQHHCRGVRVGHDLPRHQGRRGVLRRHGRDASDMPLQKYVHDALICLHSGAGNSDAALRIAEALAGYRRPAVPPCSRRNKKPNRDKIMDFTLSNEQRAWQMTARKFAEEEIRPISLERDEISDPRETFDWEIIKKGSRLGFRTMAVPKEWGGQGTDFVDPGAGDGRARQGRQRDLQDLQPMLEVEPPDRRHLHRRAEGAFPQAVPRGRHFPARQGHQRAGRGLRQPAAAGRRSQGRAETTRRAHTATNGSSTARSASSPTPASASCSSSTRAPTRTSR